jgi:malate dehydrogenase
MLLKLNPAVTHVSVFDMVGAPGVAADLSHIDTPASVSGHGMTLKQFAGPDALPEADKVAFQAKAFDDALAGCDIVVRGCPPPRPPGLCPDPGRLLLRFA